MYRLSFFLFNLLRFRPSAGSFAAIFDSFSLAYFLFLAISLRSIICDCLVKWTAVQPYRSSVFFPFGALSCLMCVFLYLLGFTVF